MTDVHLSDAPLQKEGVCTSEVDTSQTPASALLSLLNHVQINGNCVNNPQGSVEWPPPPPSSRS